MIGSLNSSLALAQRTATKARATMDTMSRQIATGQKVSSVKDDGAAWTRANWALGDSAASRALSDSLGQVKAGVVAAQVLGDSRADLLAEMRSTALAASDASLSATSRQQLQTFYTQLRDSYLTDQTYTAHAGSIGLNNASGAPWGPYSATMGVADLSWTNSIDGSTASQAFASAMVAPAGDISTSGAAATTLANVQTVETLFLQRAAVIAGVDRRIEGDQRNLSQTADRLLNIASSLTDADLAKVSAQKAQAETRQQLALATIQQAISAYSNYATGLLGNAQRTQMSVRT